MDEALDQGKAVACPSFNVADIPVPQQGRELCQHLDEASGHLLHIVSLSETFFCSKYGFYSVLFLPLKLYSLLFHWSAG